MFTGLVQALGTVRALERDGEGARIEIEAPALVAEVKEGDSVAVNGVCLTATAIADGAFSADAVAETLACTSLGQLELGSPVNLELPVRANDRLGGHIVQGHVDGTGTIARIGEQRWGREIEIAADPELLRYVAQKGSVALDGVSLTVAFADSDRFGVALIPETLARTTFGRAQEGATVNIEVDIVAKYVERLTEKR